MKSYFRVGIILYLTSVTFCFAGTHPRAQWDFAKKYPWPPLHSPVPHGSIRTQLPSSAQPGNLFTSNLHQDTSMFVAVSSSLPGVIAGDATWIDYDNDGDLDVLVAGWNDTTYITRIYRNDNGTFNDIHASLIQIGSEHGIAWGDYDNDGDYDLAVVGRTDVNGLNPVTRIYRNDEGSFVDIQASLMQLNGGSVSWVDFDGDGDLDLLGCGSPDAGNTFFTRLYRNDNGKFTDLNIPLQGVWGSAVAWSDYDNDGDPDLLLTGYGWGAHTILYRNDGPAGDSSWIFTDVYAGLQPVNSSAVIWADYDNDGDPDIILSGGSTIIYRNDGNGTFTDIHAGLQDLIVSALAVGDYDNDGDLDIALSGTTDFWAGTPMFTKIYRNDNGSFTDINAGIQPVWFGSLAWGDYDNDGRLDLIVTGGTLGRPYYSYLGPYNPITLIYRNTSAPVNAPPSAPANGLATPTTNGAQFSWDRATDDHTPRNTVSYNLRLGSSPGGCDIVGADANMTTGYHRIPRLGNTGRRAIRSFSNLPPGTYYWSVQSIDNGYAASGFTPEQSFTVGSIATSWWHMASLPYQYSDTRKSVIFPTATSNAFGYNTTTGYFIQDNLENGYGYWVKFPSSSLPAPLSGAGLPSITVQVKQGWNLIGSVSQAITTSQIQSHPGGMVTSQFFGYNGSYFTSNTIDPGRAYWVKVNQDGELVLASSGMVDEQAAIRIVETSEAPPLPPQSEIRDPKSAIPKAFSLGQNYPNPFNPLTVISYQLPVGTHVTLKVSNLLGQEVRTLVDEDQSGGYKSVNFDAGGLPSGIYLYKLTAGSFVEVRKMVVMR